MTTKNTEITPRNAATTRGIVPGSWVLIGCNTDGYRLRVNVGYAVYPGGMADTLEKAVEFAHQICEFNGVEKIIVEATHFPEQ